MNVNTVFIDVDGVLVNFMKRWTEYYENDTGIRVNWKTMPTYKMSDMMPVTPEYKYLLDPHFYDDIEMMPNAIESVEELHSLGYDIVFITACVTNESVTSKLELLQRLFPWFYVYKNFIVMRQKEWIQIDHSVIIDDQPKMLTLSEYTYTVGFAWSYNKYVESHVNLYTNDWKEIVRFIKYVLPNGR